MSFSETALCYALTFIVLSTTPLLFIIPDYDANPFFDPSFFQIRFLSTQGIVPIRPGLEEVSWGHS